MVLVRTSKTQIMHFRFLIRFVSTLLTTNNVSFLLWKLSRYTVIQNDCGLKALAHFLDKRPVIQPATSTLIRLAELVLTLKISFNGAFYRQVAGVAMGSKMGPNYACLFVSYMEEAILSQFTGLIPQLQKGTLSTL